MNLDDLIAEGRRALEMKKIESLAADWQPEALVLTKQEHICRNCASRISLPASIGIRYKHKTKGIHIHAYERPDNWTTLPREINTLPPHSIISCESCFLSFVDFPYIPKNALGKLQTRDVEDMLGGEL